MSSSSVYQGSGDFQLQYVQPEPLWGGQEISTESVFMAPLPQDCQLLNHDCHSTNIKNMEGKTQIVYHMAHACYSPPAPSPQRWRILNLLLRLAQFRSVDNSANPAYCLGWKSTFSSWTPCPASWSRYRGCLQGNISRVICCRRSWLRVIFTELQS
jgi:hypothetical protein